ACCEAAPLPPAEDRGEKPVMSVPSGPPAGCLIAVRPPPPKQNPLRAWPAWAARWIRAPGAPPRAASTQLATSALAHLPSRVLLVHHDGTGAPPDDNSTVFLLSDFNGLLTFIASRSFRRPAQRTRLQTVFRRPSRAAGLRSRSLLSTAASGARERSVSDSVDS